MDLCSLTLGDNEKPNGIVTDIIVKTNENFKVDKSEAFKLKLTYYNGHLYRLKHLTNEKADDLIKRIERNSKM